MAQKVYVKRNTATRGYGMKSAGVLALGVIVAVTSCKPSVPGEAQPFINVLDKVKEAVRKDDFRTLLDNVAILDLKLRTKSGPFGAVDGQVVYDDFLVTMPEFLETLPPRMREDSVRLYLDAFHSAARSKCGLDVNKLGFQRIEYMKREGDRVLLKTISAPDQKEAPRYFAFVVVNTKPRLLLKTLTTKPGTPEESMCAYVFDGISPDFPVELRYKGEDNVSIKSNGLSVHEWLTYGVGPGGEAKRRELAREEKASGRTNLLRSFLTMAQVAAKSDEAEKGRLPTVAEFAEILWLEPEYKDQLVAVDLGGGTVWLSDRLRQMTTERHIAASFKAMRRQLGKAHVGKHDFRLLGMHILDAKRGAGKVGFITDDDDMKIFEADIEIQHAVAK